MKININRSDNDCYVTFLDGEEQCYDACDVTLM